MTIPATENAAAWALAVGVLAGLALCAASCKDTPPPAPAPDASASASPPASAVASATPDEASGGGGDEIRPVYPIDNKPPLPLAQRYCDAVQATPLKRREECCS